MIKKLVKTLVRFNKAFLVKARLLFSKFNILPGLARSAQTVQIPISRANLILARARGWLIGFIFGLYLIGLLGVSWLYYLKGNISPAVINALRIYPLPAALVNGRVISAAGFEREYLYIEQFSSRTGQPIEPSKARSGLGDQLVERVLLNIQAGQSGIRVSQAEIDQAFNDLAKDNGGETEVKKVLFNLYGMSVKDFKRLIAAQLIKDKVRQELLIHVQAKHIVINNEKKAKEVLERAIKGDNFDDLAREFSQDIASADKGGDLGKVERGQLVKELEQAVFSAPVDQVQPELVKSEFGFHVIKVEQRSGRIDKTFDDFLKELKDKAKVRKLINF